MNPNQVSSKPAELVDALNGTFGKHPGARASHAKGIGVIGEFEASAQVDVTGVQLLQAGSKAKVFGRLSVGGGNPGQPDTSRTVRGFALNIAYGAQAWNLVLISAPVFFARDAQQFVQFLAARKPDPARGGPNPDLIAAFNAANPNTLPHQVYLKSTAPTACYTHEHYHSAHAYGMPTASALRWARLELRPAEGRLGISADEEKTLPPSFLFGRLTQRLASDLPAEWDLIASFATSTDAVTEVTTPWEGLHEELVLGRVRIHALDSDQAHLEYMFDPSRIATGIKAPEDPVFPLRSPAYAISFERRQA